MKGEVRLQLWCTPEQKVILKWAAKDLGYKNISYFVKAAVIEKLERERHKSTLNAIALTGEYNG